MTIFRDAWVLVRADFRGDKLNIVRVLLFSIIFMGYMAAMTGMVTEDALSGSDGRLMSDFLLISMIPMLGFTFSRRTMKYLSEDSYTRMLAYMRSLPVPAAVILCKRKLDAMFSFCLNGVLFFGLMYAISDNIRSQLSGTSYVAFAFTWIGYGLMMTGIYIVVEFLVSGKAYFWITLTLMLLSFGVALLIQWGDGNLFLYSVSCSKEWGLLSPLMWGTLLLGTVSVQLFSKLTIHRLKSRDLV
ncbi:hypothetical protein H70357_02685 [Paenibacillus sp. FSL H7-0357]|uniref:hypothetical protein n=1 Tax=Paenibacillus sp. FSL H7-0357 TaxID=1536774 RepID=UPI0004F6DEC8|nr:hypothetical protein [Paenibacillus sp. FSL H7-0357]AIQ15722.1 hypothetical protein H70357_02685 [Paenibacillus sp. FSL H7-0357]